MRPLVGLLRVGDLVSGLCLATLRAQASLCRRCGVRLRGLALDCFSPSWRFLASLVVGCNLVDDHVGRLLLDVGSLVLFKLGQRHRAPFLNMFHIHIVVFVS